jgi:hypothetical protein
MSFSARLSASLLVLGSLSLAACGDNNNNDVEICTDGADNDADDLVDCDDNDCDADAACEINAVVDGLAAPESAFFDAGTNSWYVSNQAANVAGDGFISKLDQNGNVVALNFTAGLNDPRGIRVDGDTLFVSDSTDLVSINLADGQVIERIAIPGSQFLNDVAVDPANGDVYISDSFANIIFRVVDGVPEEFLADVALEAPNGLLVEGGNLLLNGLGVNLDQVDFSTDEPGQLQTLNLADKTLTPSGNRNIGNVGLLDGLERDGDNLLVTDFAGGLFSVDAAGTPTLLLDNAEGGFITSADIGFNAARRLVAIPDITGNKVVFFDLDNL